MIEAQIFDLGAVKGGKEALLSVLLVCRDAQLIADMLISSVESAGKGLAGAYRGSEID